MASRSKDLGRATISALDGAGAAAFLAVTAGVGAGFVSLCAGAPPCANAAVAARRNVGRTLFKSIIGLKDGFQELTSVCRFTFSVNRVALPGRRQRSWIVIAGRVL